MDATLKPGNAIDPSQWDRFVESSPQGNIYHLHTYLSHLTPRWEAVVLEEGGQIVAGFPFERKVKWGISYAVQPHFAQYLGILFAQKTDQAYKRFEFEKKAIQLIHDTLPTDLKLLQVHFAPEFDYDLPLIWLGWTQTMRYTYWVDIRKGYEAFLQSCASHVRREIKKSAEMGLKVRAENNPELVVSILKTAKPVVAKEIAPHFFEALCKNARHFYEQRQSCCLIAYDGELPVAGIIYFFYQKKMIYYQGSTLPAYKNSGAMTTIIAESVRLFGDSYQILDFDGSMLEPIERFFRGFGAYPVRYGNFCLDRLPFWAKWGNRLRAAAKPGKNPSDSRRKS